MVCKCGAMVKASAQRLKSPELGADMGKRAPADGYRALGGENAPDAGWPDLEPPRFWPVQEPYAIEARSKEVTTSRGKA